MKKIILGYGIYGGLVVAAELIGFTLYFRQTNHFFENGMVIGYTAMLLAFSLIFVALKQLRDKQYGGDISFGKAFKAALLITLVTATLYVLVWLVCYYVFMPDFMEQYAAHIINKAKADGMSPAKLAEQTAQLQTYSDMYKNPLFVILFTYAEILPVGVLVSLIAALVIRRKGARLQEDKIYAAGNI